MLLTTIFLSYSGVSYADVSAFQCQTGVFWNDGATIAVVARINDGGDSGFIEVADRTYTTSYGVDGVNRRWVWDAEDEAYSYSFVLKPDSIAVYSKFRKTNPEEIVDSQVFVCR